jgi:hypothetical protein
MYPKVSGLSPYWNTKQQQYALVEKHAKYYGGKTHYADSQNKDTTAPSGRELYHVQFSLQATSPETSGYTLVCV